MRHALRNDLSTVRDELRQAQIDYQTQSDKAAALDDEVQALRSGRPELDASRKECKELREQVSSLQQKVALSARASSISPRKSEQFEELVRLRKQIAEMNSKQGKADNEKQTLQDKLTAINSELKSAKSSLAEAKAERDELNIELQRSKAHDSDTVQVDQERLSLRTAKTKLDNEIRRLKEENKTLSEQRDAIEKTLEEEIEKAADEEERLGQEILQLQTKLRQTTSSETGELASARRTIRELERSVEDYKTQLELGQYPEAEVEGNSELSMMKKDLSAARQKELEFRQREAAHKDMVKGYKRQIADLERKGHDDEISRLIASPRSSFSDSGKTDEVSELRNKLKTAQQTAQDLKSKHREAERKASQATQNLQQQLEDLEDQKLVLEECLEEARQQAEETAEQHERVLDHMKRKLEKASRLRSAAAPQQQQDTSKSDRKLRKTQAEIENLEHDVLHQQETIDALVASEASLRRKLERARTERAAYQMSAEKLKVDTRGQKILLTEPPMNPLKNREQMCEVMFDRYEFGGVYVAIQAVLALYAQGKPSHRPHQGVVLMATEEYKNTDTVLQVSALVSSSIPAMA